MQPIDYFYFTTIRFYLLTYICWLLASCILFVAAFLHTFSYSVFWLMPGFLYRSILILDFASRSNEPILFFEKAQKLWAHMRDKCTSSLYESVDISITIFHIQTKWLTGWCARSLDPGRVSGSPPRSSLESSFYLVWVSAFKIFWGGLLDLNTTQCALVINIVLRM